MKKFNSIIAIAAVAISSVFGLSSCEKDNSAFDQDKNTIERPNNIFHVDQKPIKCFGSFQDIYSTTTTDTANVVVLTAKDYAGTYKYTSEDGKEWVIVLTETATASEGCYSASITVPEGEEVAAKTYDGYFKVLRNCALFCSTDTKGGTDNNNLVNFMLKSNNDNTKNLTAIIKLNNRSATKTLAFVKQ